MTQTVFRAPLASPFAPMQAGNTIQPYTQAAAAYCRALGEQMMGPAGPSGSGVRYRRRAAQCSAFGRLFSLGA